MSVKKAGVVGGGLMGVGIATKFALAGYDSVVYETSSTRIAEIPQAVQEILSELLEGRIVSSEQSAAAATRVRPTSDFNALQGIPIVIEAIPEIFPAKQELYHRLEATLAPDALLASNTSGFMPDALSAKLIHRDRFLIAHFWNPPHFIPLVEVVPGSTTDQKYIDLAVRILHDIAAEPVVLRTPLPGFIGNRLQYAVLREALHLVRSGAADAATVDAVMKASLGRRYAIMGPLEAADLGGLETFLKISAHLMPELAKDEGVLDVLRAHTEKGERGAATGRGFYEWTEERKRSLRKKRLEQYLKTKTS